MSAVPKFNSARGLTPELMVAGHENGKSAPYLRMEGSLRLSEQLALFEISNH